MLVSSLSSIALACGGFFCDPGPPTNEFPLPVEQTGEVVVFAVDEAGDETTMHVQVSFEGEAAEFAWVLPVPSEPVLLRSSQALFDHVTEQTRPQWTAQFSTTDCPSPPPSEREDSDADTDVDTDADTDADADADGPAPTVSVVARQNLGPYETVTLTATDAGDLVAWLQDNGFAIPDAVDAALAPYLGDTTHFVALRLQKSRDVGDLEPFAMRFAGATPSIPIQLTALAVGDDMPIDVYVLGPMRAIPENYLHVRRNPFKSDWRFETDDLEIVGRAADEAGGQAFETVFSDRIAAMDLPGPASIEWLASAPDLDTWLTRVAADPLWNAVNTGDLAAVVELPEGVDPVAFFTCPQCTPTVLAAIPFDAATATDALVEHWLEPAREAALLIDRATMLTRLRSTMSASEMTLDPQFGFRELDPVSQFHLMTVERRCGAGQTQWDAAQRVRVEDFEFLAPSANELAEQGDDLYSWLAALGDDSAMVIEDLSTGEILVDHRPEFEQEYIPDAVAGSPSVRRAARMEACGCRTSPISLGAWMLPLLVLARRRRGEP